MSLTGTVVGGRYEIRDEIGRGGFGTVYRAFQANVNRDVAVKVLNEDASRSEKVVQRFEVEAKIISKLQHPNTLSLIDYGRTETGALFVVTELLQGSTLEDEVGKHGALPIAKVLSVVADVLSALEEAHDNGIIHRDLKPDNIYLQRVGRRDVVKVLDFGIAKLAEGDMKTATGEIFGTPAFMSPEQIRGETVDGRSDLYSMGVVAFRCLTGKLPFTASQPFAILMKHVNEAPPTLAEMNPDLQDPQLEQLVASLLAKGRDERPESAGAVLDVIEDLQRVHYPRRSTLPGRLPETGAPSAAPAEGRTPTVISGRDSIPSTTTNELSGVVETLPAAVGDGRKRTTWVAAAVLMVGLGAALTLFTRTPEGEGEPPSVAATHPPENKAPPPSPPEPEKPTAAPEKPVAAPAPPDASPAAVARPYEPPPAKRRRRAKRKPRKPPPKAAKPKTTVASLKLSISPRRATYGIGESAKLQARALDPTSKPVAGAPIKWSVRPAGAATIQGAGAKARVRFVRGGPGTIEACAGAKCSTLRFISLDKSGVP